MNYCIYCGIKISANVKFCPKCGNPVYGPPADVEQKAETDKEPATVLESESNPVSVEQPVQNEECAAEGVVTQEYKPNGVGITEQKNRISTLAIILCSIAVVMVITLVVVLVVRHNKPKYRIVNQVQTTQTTPSKAEVPKQKTDKKVTDSAKKTSAEPTGETLVYSIATDGYANIRHLPDADSYVVGVLATNREGARLISNQGTWWKVRIGKVEGYVNSKYVKLSDTPVKISGLPKVYYVVLKSHDTMEDAQNFNRVCADGMECWIYKCTSNGKTVYRLCVGCFSTRSDAQDRINECRSLYDGAFDYYTNAWIWESKGLGNCVYCPPIYEEVVEGIGNFPPLSPTRGSKSAIMEELFSFSTIEF